jgi:hypothetical protein
VGAELFHVEGHKTKLTVARRNSRLKMTRWMRVIWPAGPAKNSYNLCCIIRRAFTASHIYHEIHDFEIWRPQNVTVWVCNHRHLPFRVPEPQTNLLLTEKFGSVLGQNLTIVLIRNVSPIWKLYWRRPIHMFSVLTHNISLTLFKMLDIITGCFIFFSVILPRCSN